jgi:hypothetical protein
METEKIHANIGGGIVAEDNHGCSSTTNSFTSMMKMD